MWALIPLTLAPDQDDARSALVLFLVVAMLLLLGMIMLLLLTLRRWRRAAARARPPRPLDARDAWHEAGRRAEP